jgi:hypothetical protein
VIKDEDSRMTPEDKEILRMYDDAIGLAGGYIYSVFIGFPLLFIILAINNC